MNAVGQKKSFALGYSMVLHSLITWFFFIAAASTGLNVLVPGFAAKSGVEVTQLLSVNTIGALFAVVASILFARLAMSVGLKVVIVSSLIVGGIIGTMGLGLVSSLAGYTVCCIVAQCAANGYSNSITNNVITNWFPRKRGTALGITTCGVPLAVIFAVPWLGKMMANPNYGFNKTVFILGGAILIFGIISIFWIKNTPEECGLDPDNMPLTDEEKKGRLLAKESEIHWTWIQVLKNKQAWLIILAFGLFYITCTGFSAQIIPYLMEAGYEAGKARSLMGYTAFFGLAGSLLSGVIDSKLGTKVSCIIYGIVTTAGFAVLLIGKSTPMILACLFIECTTMGAIANLLPSMTLQCFGRSSFTSVNRIVFPGVFAVRAICYVLLALGIKHLGGYINTYSAFSVLCIVALILMVLINTKEIQEPLRR